MLLRVQQLLNAVETAELEQAYSLGNSGGS